MPDLIEFSENNNILDYNYTIIWNLFNISSSTNLQNINNIKKYSLLHFEQISLNNNKTSFKKDKNTPFDTKFIEALYKAYFDKYKTILFSEPQENLKLIQLYNNKNIYYVGIFRFNINEQINKGLILNNNINIDSEYKKTLFIELNNSIKHKKTNFIKGILNCNMNSSYLENETIILDSKTNFKIKLKLLLTTIQNYFWLFDWTIC